MSYNDGIRIRNELNQLKNTDPQFYEALTNIQKDMNRFRPIAKVRAAPIKKPYSNLTIILSENKTMEKHGTKS